MKQILVTGGNGQLGKCLRKISGSHKNFSFAFIDIGDLDLTDPDAVAGFFNASAPDYIINCAAFTAVDTAEQQPANAFRVNAGIPKNLGKIATERKIHLLHISTDFVYDGKLSLPHREDEVPDPLSVYAQSKYDGDRALIDNPFAIIVRTSWLYSEFGQNFLTNMLRLGAERKELGVVFDQTGTPTYGGDLAQVLIKIIDYSENGSFPSGIYNYSNEGVCSWYDFALEIMRFSRSQCVVKPIRTAEYPLPAPRPAYGVMDKAKIKRIYDIQIPYWRDSLLKALENLEKNQEI